MEPGGSTTTTTYGALLWAGCRKPIPWRDTGPVLRGHPEPLSLAKELRAAEQALAARRSSSPAG